ncbi:MAG TPA: hypothetical protein DEA08_25240 [Planctomycetes bacterium]|nr:hypothetical protein [Planctomycetota bacterium]
MRSGVITIFLLASLGWGALAQDSQPTSQPTSRPTSDPAQDGDQKPAKPAPKRVRLPALGHPAGVYGAGVSQSEAVRLPALAKVIDRLHGRPIRLDGRISDVCRKKGCWMVLREGGEEIRVRFKDYAFFVPRDSAGREVIVEGIATRKTIPEAEARHYAEESGDPEAAKKIKGPQQVLAFTATGAEILGGQSLPPRAEPSSDAARAALVEAIAAGARVPGPALRAPLPNLKQALRFLRALKGPRSVEFSLCAQLEGVAGKPGEVYVFSASERAFARGYAVLANGEVIAFGGQK